MGTRARANRRWTWGAVVVLAALGWEQVAAEAAPPRAEAADDKPCQVVPAVGWSNADAAMMEGRFEEAERLFAAMPPTPAATDGLIRAKAGAHKLDEALAMAERENAAHPNDPALVDLLGEVRFRRGEVEEAAKAYDRSTALDPCRGRTHYDISQLMNLNGRYASAQVQLNMAHYLSPADPVIRRAWEQTQRVPETPDQTIARLRKLEERGDLSDERKAAIGTSIQALQAREKGNCELTKPVQSAKVPMWASNSSNSSTRPPTNSGVDVFLNGKRRRLIVDTGAGGLLLSKEAAKSLGLVPEAEIKTSGFGDSGPSSTYVAHVDSVKIGGLEFHNCIVRVLENNNMPWTDGLLGPDVFRSFVVTLDFPGSELRLGQLPPLPDQTAETATSLATRGDEGANAGLTIAESRRDRYIAPQMRDWEHIYRSGHDLIFPTQIGNAPRKLFIMDTGSGQNLISIDAAKEVTGVNSATGGKVSGLSGKVNNVAGTDALYLQFAHVRQVIPGGINAIDLSGFSRSAGVEISGFIGYPLLKELVISVDYRDNLVKVEYKPHVAANAH